MKATWIGTEKTLEPSQTQEEEAVDLKDYTFYVYCCGGEVEEVTPATALRLTTTEFLFLLGEIVVGRMPRKKVYLAAHEPVAIPTMF
jgi:hypothetical protein